MYLVWFSAGAASAVSAKYAVKEHGDDCRVIYCDTGSEHEDNKRFLKDVEKWIDHPIEILKNEKYKDHWDVMEKTRYLIGPGGARCSVELKKKIRIDVSNIDDIHVLGYTIEETTRASDFDERNEFTKTYYPLIKNNISKSDCLGIIWKAGIEIPAMYKMGYNHNNCIGCPRGKAGYWNKIRVDFPEAFDRMAKLERELGRSINRRPDGTKTFLDQLDPNAGNYKEEPPISCGIGCQLAMSDLT